MHCELKAFAVKNVLIYELNRLGDLINIHGDGELFTSALLFPARQMTPNPDNFSARYLACFSQHPILFSAFHGYSTLFSCV